MGSGGKDKEPRQKKKPGRVPTSCKECRRLKLRCDRNVPCEKCVSRGCGSICPDGVLTPGKGGRLYLADTEELYNRIEQISSRNRDLENALRRLQETVSDQPHPLLSTQDSLLRLNIIQHGSSSGPSTSSSSKSPSTSRISPTTHPPDPPEMRMDEDHNVIDAFGTLVMNRRGESSFLGKTARPEYLAQATNKNQRLSRPTFPRLTKRIMEISFPESELHNDSLLAEVLSFLPPHDEALHLCEVYLEYGKFLYSPVSRKELFEETLAVVYRAKHFGVFEHYHSLSLLFIVFAIATLFSPNKQPFSIEAQEYYHLSRTSLGFTQPFAETTLTSVQVLIHMSQYLDLSDLDPGGIEAAWMHVGNAMRLGLKVGLHFNSSRWKLPQEAVQRRHALFWRLFVSDAWTSLHHGRSPGISRTHFDCPIPAPASVIAENGHARFDSDGDSPEFHEWNIGFTLELHSVLEAAFGPKQPVYSAILGFDRRIRDIHVPVQWRTPAEEERSAPPPDVAMYRWLVLSAKEIVLLNLHRAYFAQALQESPADLQRHRYLPSVVAIFRSSWRLIRGLAMTWMVIPKFLARVNLAWSHGLSAAIVMCLFVTRAPTSHMTTAALEELDNLTSLFDSSASSCRPAAKLLNSVQTLWRKAHESIGLPHARFHHTDEKTSISLTELDRLNGKTYLHAEHGSSSSASSTSNAINTDTRSRATSVTISDIAEGHPPSSSSSSPFYSAMENVHPTIAQDLREFGLRNTLASSAVPSMSFFDFPSDPLPLPLSMPESVTTPQPVVEPARDRDRDRYSPPETARLLLQPFQPPLARIEPFQTPYLYPAASQHYHHDPFMDPRKMMLAPVLQSGFSGGFGASPIALDSSWNSFVEQLGF